MATLQTLDRGLRVLLFVSHAPEGVSVGELAEQLGVHRAICYRIVATLEAHALVVRTNDGRIRLGVGSAVLASRFEPQFAVVAQPVLDELANTTEATAFISAAQGEDCVVLMVAEPQHTILRVAYRVGTRHSLTQGSAGLAILATRAEGPDDSAEVQLARRDGYSLTRDQLQRGAVGIASGVRTTLRLDPGVVSERSVGVVAIDGLDTTSAIKAVKHAARRLEQLLEA